MTGELPELERLLMDAAERRYGTTRSGFRARIRPLTPTWRLVASLAALATFAIVLASTFSLTRDDEGSGGDRGSVPGANRLATAYGVFAETEASLEGFDPSDPVMGTPIDSAKALTSKTLYERDGVRIYATVGVSRASGRDIICLARRSTDTESGSCANVDDLLAKTEPHFGFGMDVGEQFAWALVRDDMSSVRAVFDDGTSEDVPIADNVAYVQAPRTICRLTWLNRNGGSGVERTDGAGTTSSGCGDGTP